MARQIRTGVKEFTLRDPVHDIELGTVNMIRHQRRVRGAAWQFYPAPMCIDNVPLFVVVAEYSSHVTDVMKKASNEKMRVIAC